MKRALIIGAIVAVVASVGVGLLALSRASDWTTASPEALGELEMALQARMKLYEQDAAQHLVRALELDPGFVAAKLSLLNLYRFVDGLDPDELWKEIEAADLDRLTPRERVLVQRVKARRAEQYEEAERLVEQYLVDYPDDPYVLNIKASAAWSRGDLMAAERDYRQLIKISPNWVLGYNHLGYITMSQGRFAEAEEYFTSYRFIAPDQANPHDSLGELYIVLGRYDEAVESLEQAISIRPSFFASYEHLFLAHVMREDLDAASEVVERLAAVEDSPEKLVQALRCVVEYLDLELRHEWQKIIELEGSECYAEASLNSYIIQVTHRAAVVSGQRELAIRIEDDVREEIALLEGAEHGKGRDSGSLITFLDHLIGVRLAIDGELGEAVSRLRDTDRRLSYMGASLGIFKLSNRLILIEVLRGLGREIEAHRMLDQQVRVTNPEMARSFEEKGLKLLGVGD